MKLPKILVVPDCHHPYVDKRAWELLLQAGKLLKPEIIVVLGDFIDFYAVSDHDKDPRRPLFLEEELEAGKAALAQLSALGARRKIYIAGNHEDRLRRYLLRKAPELLLSLELKKVLGLAETHWEYVPYREHVEIGRVKFTHDLGAAGRYAVHKALDAAHTSIVIGHLHRFSYIVEGDALGEHKVAFCPGWLGDVEAVDYMHRLKVNRDWAHGFAYGYLLPDGVIHFHAVPIVQYRAIVEGALLTAR